MSQPFDLVLRNVRMSGRASAAIGICDGRIAAIGPDSPMAGPELDGRQCTVMPGLVDHHIHLLATAARMQSVDLAGASNPSALFARLREADRQRDAGEWLRATGYDERAGGLLNAEAIDHIVVGRPVRIQSRTGTLWMLNSAALREIGAPPYPAGVELDGVGRPIGRIWRCDGWLRDRIAARPPSLAPLGRQLLRYGVTSVTDAGAANGPDEAALVADAVHRGDLPQRLTMMGREDLAAVPGIQVGPLKLHYGEDDWPEPAVVARRIETARAQGRAIAAHCTTTAELLLYLAALDHSGGARPGDRVEHGSMIPHSLVADIARAGLVVVTQPGFVHDRGDRYLDEIPDHEMPDLYRLGSLLAGGVAVAAGSDAPYGDPNPWIGILAAQQRLTRTGRPLGPDEAISREAAVALYRPLTGTSGGKVPALSPGQPADLILADWDNPAAMIPDIRATIIGGQVFEFHASSAEKPCKKDPLQ